MLDLQRQGRIGTFPPIKGQEAAQIGAVAVLRDSDWLVPSFRETAAEMMRGRTMESVLLYYSGYNEGTVIPENQQDLPMSVPGGLPSSPCRRDRPGRPISQDRRGCHDLFWRWRNLGG